MKIETKGMSTKRIAFMPIFFATGIGSCGFNSTSVVMNKVFFDFVNWPDLKFYDFFLTAKGIKVYKTISYGAVY